MTKVILLSQMSLPYDGIGSWTTLYQNYFKSQEGIDIIICPRPKKIFESITYSFVEKSFFNKLYEKCSKRRKLDYLSAIDKVVEIKSKYIFQLVDNYGMVKPLHDFLIRKGIRNNCYIQFFYHGFDPYQQRDSAENFYDIVNEIVVLTELSYYEFKSKISVLPNYFSILNNGIDTSQFFAIPKYQKDTLKKAMKIDDKKVFLWCSQDRPKKGLHIILDAWQKIYSEEKNIILLVVGCEEKKMTNGVKFLGRIPNNDLPKYYQIADCYLFSTLCHEGFGMTLIEALHCGCYCIASELGGVPEVLQFGKYGKLVSKPHFVSGWVQAIQEFLNLELSYPPVSEEMYSTDLWNLNMTIIIEEAKARIESKPLL